MSRWSYRYGLSLRLADLSTDAVNSEVGAATWGPRGPGPAAGEAKKSHKQGPVTRASKVVGSAILSNDRQVP